VRRKNQRALFITPAAHLRVPRGDVIKFAKAEMPRIAACASTCFAFLKLNVSWLVNHQFLSCLLHTSSGFPSVPQFHLSSDGYAHAGNQEKLVQKHATPLVYKYSCA